MKIKINDEWLNGEINFENKILTLKYNENEKKIPYEKIETLGKENEETNIKYYNENNELVSLKLLLDNEVHNNLVNDYEKDKMTTVSEPAPAPAVEAEPVVAVEPVAEPEPTVTEEPVAAAEPVASEPIPAPTPEPTVVEESAPVPAPAPAPEPTVVAEPEPVLVDEPILPSEPAAEPTVAPAPAVEAKPAAPAPSSIPSINKISNTTSYDDELERAAASVKKDAQRHIIMTITFSFVVISCILLYFVKIDSIPRLAIYLVFHFNLFIFGAVHLKHD